MTTACAPGKIILLGEHAVVYGRPALAIPVRQVQACAHVEPAGEGEDGWLRLHAPAISFSSWLHEAPHDHPLAAICRLTLDALGGSPERNEPNRPSVVPREARDDSEGPALRLTVESTIPVASGLGSSAAVSVAIVRALNDHFGGRLKIAEISDLAYRVEQLHHGTPSGIDNTVVAYNRPVFFVRGHPPEPLVIGAPLLWIIGDTGVAASTAAAVSRVRSAWQADPARLEALFDEIAVVVDHGRQAIVQGDAPRLGSLMTLNHQLLTDLEVSSPQLDRLVESALAAGALGAKMSGGGMGGNMVALAPPELRSRIVETLRSNGAVNVIQTEVAP